MKHEHVNDHDEYVRLPSDSHQRNTAEGAVSPLKLDSVANSQKRIRAKHVPAYLAQTIFGFNRRNLQTRFLDTLRHTKCQAGCSQILRAGRSGREMSIADAREIRKTSLLFACERSVHGLWGEDPREENAAVDDAVRIQIESLR